LLKTTLFFISSYFRYSAYTLGRLENPRKWQLVLKRRQKALQDATIEAAKLEFKFDENFLKTYGEQSRNKQKKTPQQIIGLLEKDGDK